jgi:STE24 endopeptidase
VAEFDAGRQATARQYADLRHRLTVVRWAIYLVLIALFLFALARPLADWSADVAGYWGGLVLLVTVLYIVSWAPAIPLAYYGGHVLEHRYGMSTQTARGWGKDHAKGAVIGWVFGLLTVLGIYWTINTFAAWWWVAAWLLAILATQVMAVLFPVLLAPLFFKFEPLQDEELQRRLQALAARARVPVVGVFRMRAANKTRRAMGALAGFGKTRRMILSDTLLEKSTPDEVENVMAHELGHHAHRDLGRGMALSIGVWFLGLFFLDRLFSLTYPLLEIHGFADYAGLPLLAVLSMVVSMASSPLGRVLSRRREAAADDFALRIAQKPEAFESLMVRITDQNLGIAQPRRWEELLLWDHPPSAQRVAKARGLPRNPGT